MSAVIFAPAPGTPTAIMQDESRFAMELSAFILACLSFLFCIFLIVRHWLHFYCPDLQQYMVRIMYILPLFFLEVMATLLWPQYGVWFTVLSAFYEAVIAHGYVWLILAVLGVDKINKVLAKRGSWFSWWWYKAGALQLLPVNVASTVATGVLASMSKHDQVLGDWLVLCGSVAALSSLLTIATLIRAAVVFMPYLQPYKFGQKLLCITFILFTRALLRVAFYMLYHLVDVDEILARLPASHLNLGTWGSSSERDLTAVQFLFVMHAFTLCLFLPVHSGLTWFAFGYDRVRTLLSQYCLDHHVRPEHYASSFHGSPAASTIDGFPTGSPSVGGSPSIEPLPSPMSPHQPDFSFDRLDRHTRGRDIHTSALLIQHTPVPWTDKLKMTCNICNVIYDFIQTLLLCDCMGTDVVPELRFEEPTCWEKVRMNLSKCCCCSCCYRRPKEADTAWVRDRLVDTEGGPSFVVGGYNTFTTSAVSPEDIAAARAVSIVGRSLASSRTRTSGRITATDPLGNPAGSALGTTAASGISLTTLANVTPQPQSLVMDGDSSSVVTRLNLDSPSLKNNSFGMLTDGASPTSFSESGRDIMDLDSDSDTNFDIDSAMSDEDAFTESDFDDLDSFLTGGTGGGLGSGGAAMEVAIKGTPSSAMMMTSTPSSSATTVTSSLGSLPVQHVPVMGKPKDALLDRRNYINKEIYETEVDYVNGLDMFFKYYIPKLNELCAADIVDMQFRELTKIRACNKQLLADMGLAIEQYRRTKIPIQQHDIGGVQFGTVFLKHFPKMHKYSNYINSFDDIEAFITGIINNDEQSILRQTKRKLEHNTQRECSIMSLLISPVQRLVRYRLLIDELLKYTRGVQDVSNLQMAAKEIEWIANWCNDQKRASESFQKVIEIEQTHKLKHLYKPGRMFLFECNGELLKVKSNGKGVSKCKLYLFSDLLLCVKFWRRFTPGRDIRLRLDRIQSVVAGSTLIVDPTRPIFSIWDVNNYQMSFICRDVGVQQQWIQLVQETLNDVAANNPKSPRTYCRPPTVVQQQQLLQHQQMERLQQLGYPMPGMPSGGAGLSPVHQSTAGFLRPPPSHGPNPQSFSLPGRCPPPPPTTTTTTFTSPNQE